MSLSALSASFENLYVMGLRPLEIIYFFSAGIDFRRPTLTSKVGPSTESVKVLTRQLKPVYSDD